MKIGVIGLGLIGGSIFKKLQSLDYQVIGVSTSVTETNVTKDYNTLKDCNIVFVCTPMRVTLDILDKLENYLPENTIVTDVCSLKTFVSNKIYKYKFIPSHPMAGTENSGWDSSFPELFRNATWAITPLNNEVIDEIDVLENIIRSLGAKPLITTAEEHDRAVALISHAPLVISQALCETIKDNKLAQTLASSGFRDMTRLAMSNTTMATDMVEMNKKNINFAINELNKVLDNIMDKNYSENAKEIQNFRRNLFS